MAYLYIVRCKGGTLYTGIALDIASRMRDHAEKNKKCAKYTRSHPVQSLEALWETESYAAAAKGEYAVKKLTRAGKERLIANPVLLTELCPRLAENNLVFLPVCGLTLEELLKKD